MGQVQIKKKRGQQAGWGDFNVSNYGQQQPGWGGQQQGGWGGQQ